MSLSNIGRHSLRYSITVTLLPKRARMEANSMPMTPAPTMTMVSGRDCSCSASVDVITLGLSMPVMEGILDSDPVAMMMLSASTVVSPMVTV